MLCEFFFPPLFLFAGWEGGETGSLKRHQVLFTLRKVRRSPLLPRILCLPSEAFCDAYKHEAVSAAHKRWETQCHSAILSQLDFIVRTAFPLRRESTTKRGVGQKKNCLGTNLCVIIQIKKRQELSVRRVSPAYSPRCVKHELILCGSDAAVCTVLGEKDQIIIKKKKGSWHFKFYWLVPFRSVWTLYTPGNKHRNTARQSAKELLPFFFVFFLVFLVFLRENMLLRTDETTERLFLPEA